MKLLTSQFLVITLVAFTHAAFAQPAEKSASPATANPTAEAQGQAMNLGNIRVVKVQGRDAKLVDAAGHSSPLKEGFFIRQGAKIQTGKDATVVLLFDNGTTVNIKPETEFAVEKFAQDPFDSNGVDYQTLKSEPSSSVTRLSVPDGTIVLDIAKLKKDSSFQISTPVGSAGIRGTSLGITCSKSNPSNPVTLAVSTGVVQMKTATGSRAVSGGQSFGIGSAGGFSPNPPGGADLQSASSQAAAAMKNDVKTNCPPNAFQGAPPAAAAPIAPGSSLSPAQQQTLEAASEKGSEALAAAVEQLAKASPEAAAAIAAAAADALPVAATTVAAAAATAAPAAAVAIAANVAQVAPSAAPQVAATVAAIVPAAAVQVAQSVATAAPQAAAAIATAVVTAVPTANATAIQAATQAGAQQSTQPSTAAPNQPQNTGDQGSSTQGQSLPGSNGSNAGGGSGTPPRPQPTPPIPTPTPASN